MAILSNEKTGTRIIAIGIALVTLTVFTQSVTDPVNVTKLFLLGGVSFAAIGACYPRLNATFIKSRLRIFVSLLIFGVASISTLLMSKAPFVQSFYGVYGRNNGYLMYFLLTILFISTLTISHRDNFKLLLAALAFSGTVNVIYALWVLAFGDFVGWSNPYGNLLGTLGNPNFIGSFFGMFSSLLFVYVLSPEASMRVRICALGLVPLVFLGIVQSHAVQGKVLFITGFAITSFYWVRSRFKSILIHIGYLLLLSVGFITALLGTLQKGPLAQILYKETVSLRGQYWFAGWKTGITHPFFGVGFDSLGDWYRRSRRESALTLPGVDTVTNASHNVFLDVFSFGGWPLLIGYLAIIGYVVFSIFKFTLRNRNYDPIFVALSVVWLCYQLQSAISINQIGLAVWGWVFGAAIIAYELSDSRKLSSLQGDNPIKKSKNRQKTSGSDSVFAPGLTAGILCVVGLLLAVPPLSADMKWRSAQVSRDANIVVSTLTPSYMNPQNTFRYINIVGVFESNKLYELAHKYALDAVKFNPDSYESWRALYSVSLSTKEEKSVALVNMKRLDPLNPNIGILNK